MQNRLHAFQRGQSFIAPVLKVKEKVSEVSPRCFSSLKALRKRKRSSRFRMSGGQRTTGGRQSRLSCRARESGSRRV